MASRLTILSTLLLLALRGVNAVAQLDTSCAPGGNFNLTYWELNTPFGPAGDPDSISASSLEGCGGFQNSSIFYTDSSDGSMVMKVCGSSSTCGCVTTPNSEHCRTELRELVPSSGALASWSPLNATNRLAATLSVPVPDDSTHGTVIGQVHIVSSVSTKPVCELYYSQSGNLTMGVEQTLSGGDEVYTVVGNVAVGDQFSYEIVYEGGVLSVSINGGAAQVLSTYSLDNPLSYFKAGNYNQGSIASEVHFYAVAIDHGDGWTSIALPS